jgi:zinc carboxypeptidase/immune inhibitor InhA-like protein
MMRLRRLAVAAAALIPLAYGAPATAQPRAAQGVFRPYDGARGIEAELRQAVARHPGIARLESIGKTVQGRDILAVKVSAGDARTRPASLFLGAQHAREWITVEMVRRLMHHFLDGYGTDPAITELVRTTDVWFLPVANPDGYQYTFGSAPGARLWRKNLHGVDLNRNSAYKWGLDDEGSSPDPADETYRGPGPDSEPETRALNAFEHRVRPRLAVNFHSSAQLLMYGVGWQTATPTPDDVMYRALVGDGPDSAVPGNNAQIMSDISTSNGDSAGEAVNVHGVAMIADEMASCFTAADSDPGDAWNPDDCPSEFEFPDDEKLIQAEYQRNLPFAMTVAAAAPDPARTAPDFTPHVFATSWAGSRPQTVSVVARKSLGAPVVHYRVNGGPERTAPTQPWRGGRVYGGTDNLYFDQYRGQVPGARAGDRVEVWFAAAGRAGSRFTYRVAGAPAGNTLVLADEGEPQRNAAVYADALPAATVWDVATQGPPDPLGVLAHFKTVVWEVGSHTSDAATTRAVRDFLNEGGKLIRAGSGAAYADPLSGTGANGDDFAQYWLGVDSPFTGAGATRFTGSGVLAGATATFTGPQAAATLFAPLKAEPAGRYTGLTGPLEPFAGDGMAAVRRGDGKYARLARTVDLTAVTAAQAPKLSFALSYDSLGLNAVTFEAHTPGRDDWTTLPDREGATTPDPPPGCDTLLVTHPFLTHYLTANGEDDCTPAGTSGSWTGLFGESGGWHRTTLDLSAYAGRSVEIAITYVSDRTVLGTGTFVDDARLEIGGTVTETTDFESGLGPFRAEGGWARSGAVQRMYAAVSTDHGLTLGFGLESLPAAERAALLRG